MKQSQLDQLKATTPARIAVSRAGTRPTTSTWLRFRQDHAEARDAVHSELSADFLEQFAGARGFPVISSQAADRRDFIGFPPKGKRADQATIERLLELCPAKRDIQIVISDGLSALAVERNVPELLPMLLDGFELEGLSCGLPVVVCYGRVAIADQISRALGARLAINLIGERPGLSSGVGLSAYLTYLTDAPTISSDRTVVSNIHNLGTPPVEAGAYVVHLTKMIFEHQVSGVRLQKLL